MALTYGEPSSPGNQPRGARIYFCIHCAESDEPPSIGWIDGVPPVESPMPNRSQEQRAKTRRLALHLLNVFTLSVTGCGGSSGTASSPADVRAVSPGATSGSSSVTSTSGESSGATSNGASGASVPVEHGTLLQDPPTLIASLNAAAVESALSAGTSDPKLLGVAAGAVCSVDFYYLQYNTLGGAGEPTTASGALMVPRGTVGQCSGRRPIVLYGHGTNVNKNFNIADINDTTNTEGAFIAATFAAQGYIVIAPNYAGYDISKLDYHPYLNANQQSGEMIDALTAARTALPHIQVTSTTDSGKLFITGYSQGGYVAMATHRAMQAAGMSVTASAPMSGPYALEAFGDAIFSGQVNLGSTIFFPMLVTSYQHEYGSIYQSLTEVYEANYSQNMADLLPSTISLAVLFGNGSLPQGALFNSTTPITGNSTLDTQLALPSDPIFATGFGAGNLVTNSFRLNYVLDALANPDGAFPTPTSGVAVSVNPQNRLRKAFRNNDLRNWSPQQPVLMCGGDLDPTVFFGLNTLAMQQYWAALPVGRITIVDLNDTVMDANDTFAAVKQGFQNAMATIVAAQGETSAVESIHATEQPYCTSAARSFFDQF